MKILASAYACEPDKGSEAAVGWNWVKLISKKHDVWVITRKNNKWSIEAELEGHPNPRLHFEYVDLPKWASFWKRGPKRVRSYYYLWQFAAALKAIKLNKLINFDYAHHITFVNNWLWTSFALTPIPYVWGPIGSNSPVPKAFLPTFKDFIKDRGGTLLRTWMRLADPLYWLSTLRAKSILVINSQSRNEVPLKWLAKHKIRIEPAISVEAGQRKCNHRNSELFEVLFVGRFIPIKQPDLALDAFAEIAAKMSRVRFTLLGQGPLEKYLRKKVDRHNLSNQVRFVSWLPRNDALNMMRECDVLLFPSMEGGGMVVLEAMAEGKPVIALEWGGPGDFINVDCGIKIPVSRRSRFEVVKDIAEALEWLATDPDVRHGLSNGARLRAGEFQLEKRQGLLDVIYEAQ